MYFGGRFFNLSVAHIHCYLPLHCDPGLHMRVSQEVLQSWGEELGEAPDISQDRFGPLVLRENEMQDELLFSKGSGATKRCVGLTPKLDRCWGENSMPVSHHSPVNVQGLLKLNYQQKLIGLCLSYPLFLPVTNLQKNKS